jgi:hypothetical protein
MVNAASKRLFCPKCGWSNIRLSERSGFLDGIAALLLLSPLRCRNCRLRYYRLWFLARRAPPLVTAHRAVPAPADVPKPTVVAVDVPEAIPPAEAARKVILLLDDDPALRRLLGRLLGREGYDVCEASDAGAATAELRTTEIDLAIVNLGTREDEAVRVLRSAYPELPIIALSEPLALAEAPGKLLILPQPSRVFAVVESVRELMSRVPVDAR